MSLTGCITGSRYAMTLDLYKEARTQNAETREIERVWSKDTTISGMAWGVTASGKDFPGTYEYFDKTYEATEIVRVISAAPIPKQYKVTNIQNASGVVWKEDSIANTPATIFDSRGSVPVTDPFGRVVEYATFLTRAEVQKI